VLSDPNKREAYNASGMNPERMNARQSRGFYEYDVNRGFECKSLFVRIPTYFSLLAEVTPEEIFEMFFGGGFPGGTMYRRRAHYYHRQEAHAQQEERVIPLMVWALNFGWLLLKLLSFVRWLHRALNR
jgi:DnaJ-class molecular chaperone